jgi:hypothetical protein
MSHVEIVAEGLRRLDRLLADAYPEPPAPYSAEWLNYQSLLAQQARLFHEREILEGAFPLQIDLAGAPVMESAIDASFLQEFLDRLQKTVSSITQTLMGKARDRARFQEDVVAASRLRVLAATPGSFVLGLEGPERHQQLALDGTQAEPVFDEAMDLLLDVFHASDASVASGDLLTAASSVGDRALRHLKSLAANVSSRGARTVFTHRTAFDPEEPIREVIFGGEAARRLEELLTRAESSTQTIIVEGRLSGVSWIRKRFELEVEREDGTPLVYRGTVSVDIRDMVADSFDRHVQAVLEETTLSSEIEHESSVSHHLIELR